MNNRTVTVITPTTGLAERRFHLLDLAESMNHQGVSWRWVIACDGPLELPLPASIAHDPRVTVVTTGPRRRGAAAARNLALTRVRTQWVTSVDDDDVLPPESLRLRVDAALSELGLGWSCGRMLDLLPDGQVAETCSLMPAENLAHQRALMPAGRVEAGGVWRAWPESRSPFPIPSSAVMARTSLLRAVGGWHGLQQREDFGMAMAVTSMMPGAMIDDLVYLYRRHDGQTTATPDYADRDAVLRCAVHDRGRILTGIGQPFVGLA